MKGNKDGYRPTRSNSHPVVYLFLILPFGILAGYVTVTFAYLFSREGISVEAIASLVGAAMLPQVIKFIWAPLVDTTLSLKKWYLLSGIITAAGIIATGLLPIKESSLPVLTIILVLSNIAVSFLGMTTNALVAYNVPPEMKGRAGGYMNAGNLGGAGLGGGAGLWLAQYVPSSWMISSVLALACLLSMLGLFFVKEPQSTIRESTILLTMQNALKDVWITLKSRLGFAAVFLSFLPLGTGAASNLWSAVSGNWQASANTVALVTGILSGILTAGGALTGGWICDRMDRKNAYVIFGMIQAICLLAMAYAPHTELMYIIWTSIYAFGVGLSYAGFSAFVFEAIGKGAAATKMTVYASLSNAPIYYMTLIDGWAHTHYGPSGMLMTEAAFGVLGVILFLALMAYIKRRKTIALIATNNA